MIEKAFPNLAKDGFLIKSPKSIKYNCIAWAVGVDRVPWWPIDGYWPDKIPRNESLTSFIKLFVTLGYKICKSDKHERGFEKIAIYADTNKKVKHAARQSSSGKWTSKLGQSEDIEHTLDGLVGLLYGSVKVIMKKRK